MYDPELDDGSDDGTFVPFTDMLFNVLLGFAFMVFIAFSLINPTAKTGAVDLKGEFLVTMNWPDNDPNDMDLYVQDPAGNVAWYWQKQAGLMSLDRDDRGDYRNTITVNGQKIRVALRQEMTTIRGIIPGEYVVNVNDYMQMRKGVVPVTVKVEKLNPTASVVYYGTHDFDHKGQEETFVRFSVDAGGNVTDVKTGPFKSLIRVVRAPGHGNAPK
jgi:uncharacterized protein YfaP (DUF2135 family)